MRSLVYSSVEGVLIIGSANLSADNIHVLILPYQKEVATTSQGSRYKYISIITHSFYVFNMQVEICFYIVLMMMATFTYVRNNLGNHCLHAPPFPVS